jgi:hypothetical protein
MMRPELASLALMPKYSGVIGPPLFSASIIVQYNYTNTYQVGTRYSVGTSGTTSDTPDDWHPIPQMGIRMF